MNNLFSGSWWRDADGAIGDVQMTSNLSSSPAVSTNLDKFFEDVEAIKDELKEVEHIQRHLHESNEASKTLHAASTIRDLRARMDSDVATALKKAKLIKLCLESLDRTNTANRSIPGCGPSTSTDHTRTSVVVGLRKKLKDSIESFGDLHKKVATEHRETVERRYYTVIGQKPDEEMVVNLILLAQEPQLPLDPISCAPHLTQRNLVTSGCFNLCL